MNIRLFKPSFGSEELRAIKDTLDRSWVGLGPMVNEFEEQWKQHLGTKEAVALKSVAMNNPDMLEAEFVIKSNDMFHLLSDKVKLEKGFLDTDRILFEFNEWLNKEANKRKMKKAQLSFI